MEVPLHRHGWLNHWPLVINSISVPSFPPLTMVISFYLLPLVFSVCFLKILVLFFFQDGEGIWNFNVVLILSALQNIYIYSSSVTPSLSLIPLYSWSAISLDSSLMYPPPPIFSSQKLADTWVYFLTVPFMDWIVSSPHSYADVLAPST